MQILQSYFNPDKYQYLCNISVPVEIHVLELFFMEIDVWQMHCVTGEWNIPSNAFVANRSTQK